MPRTLAGKLGIFTVVSLLLLTLAAGYVIYNIRLLRENAALLSEHSIADARANGEYRIAVLRAIGEARVYVETGESGEYEEAVEAFGTAQELLAEASDHDDEHVEVTTGLTPDQAYSQRQQVLDNLQKLISALPQVDPATRAEISEELEDAEHNFEDIEAQIELVNAAEIDAIQTAIGAELDQSFISIALLLVVCVLFSLGILMMINRIVVRPVQHLASAFEQVANGAAPTPTLVTSNDEIGALQRHFNSMIATLQRQSISITQQVQAAETARTASEAAEREAASRLAIIEEQRETIRDMSVPVLPLDKQSLVMPLIGTLDTQRLIQIQDQALRWLESTRARRLLLDITGVPIIDSHVAQGLMRVVQAARLLGAEVVLVGIRPEVAQTIVSLGLDLRDVTTFSSLQAGIA